MLLSYHMNYFIYYIWNPRRNLLPCYTIWTVIQKTSGTINVTYYDALIISLTMYPNMPVGSEVITFLSKNLPYIHNCCHIQALVITTAPFINEDIMWYLFYIVAMLYASQYLSIVQSNIMVFGGRRSVGHRWSATGCTLSVTGL